MERACFCGAELPKFITHINLVLLPKKDIISTFSDMRPISLSNFVNKIFSRLIHDKLAEGLPFLISLNQVGFVKGKSIVENLLLTQEIIADIRLRTKTTNVVMKLDIAKAYDKGFFKYSRVIKQGDPLSPTLFILAAEVLTRNLNALHLVPQFRGFGMQKWSPKINHLAYADDMIIFSSADVLSLQLIMEVLGKYERTSGQKINKEKSTVYLHHNVTGDIRVAVEVATGIGSKNFFFTYLGCPIFYSRRRKSTSVQFWTRGFVFATSDEGYDDRIQNVNEMLLNGDWDIDRLSGVTPSDIVQHITSTIPPSRMEKNMDAPWWLLGTRGHFLVKTCWEYLRLRGQKQEIYKYIWIKGLPFKISFFMWRFWKFKLPLDEALKKINISLASRCWCCTNPKEETTQHLFTKSYAANRT
ncbi:uncharacterized protein LOC132061267 [Lycium ferocissimum]|uniref:uncharacterized protein LOC132061267 n=1 Tax=Lycium ferocissimum TaxID=112874 RepID=UPI002814A574|nr:uncharacterized protein LOC132061267 [Lycium ferocissimum]